MIAYVAKDLASGVRLAAHDDVRLPAYSTIKVLLAAAFWRAVESGDLDEAETLVFRPRSGVGGGGVLRGFRHVAELALADYAHLMLAVSDNDATNIVAGVVGFERVNDLALELGLRQTAMRRLMMDAEAVAAGRDNLTSAADLAALLEELATGETLGPAVTGPIWASLERQEHLDGIARYLPARASYAGKCGDDSPVGRYAHDCALIGEGRRRVIMAIMTDGAGGFEAVSRTGAALYEALGQDQTAG
jgi:beta-lactamase class A